MKPDTHMARAAQKTQAHIAGDDDPKPGTVKRKERRIPGVPYFEIKRHKEWMFPALPGLFKVPALIAVLLLASCRDQADPPTLSERIEGHWIGGAWHHPTSLYFFHDGAAWAARCDGEQLIDRKDYAYSESGDTLKMLDIVTFERSAFVVSFPTDSTVTLNRMGGLKVNLKRAR